MARKTDIRLRRSNTAGAIPSGSHLNEGELAINTADGALYFKKSDSTVITAHDNTIMHIDSDAGNSGANPKVGILTTNPAKNLHVAGDARISDGNGLIDFNPGYIPINATHSSGYAHIQINGMQFGGNTTSTDEGYMKPADNSRKLAVDSNGFRFYIGGIASSDELIRFDSSGRIGVGTTSPNREIDVHGSIALQNDSYYNGAYDWMFNQDGSNGRLAISYYGSEKVSIKDDGKVGIGTNSPAEKLEVSGGVTSNFFAFNTAFSGSPTHSVYAVAPRSGNLGLFTASTERLTVDGSGNVGIGDTSPGAKLHVSGGDILIDNNNSLSFENVAGAKRDILTYNSSNKVRLDNPGGSTVDLNSDTLIVHRHGRIVTGKAGQTWTNGYSRNISIQNITDSSNNGFGVWNAFIGTNLRYDTTNSTFVRASDEGSRNWGNIAAQFFNGAGSSTAAAIDWVTDIPNESVSDGSEVNVSGSTLVGLSKMTLTAGGSLGIGTRSPSSKLVVSDSGGAGLEVIPQTSNDRVTLLSYDRNSTTYQTVDFDGSDIHFNIAGIEKARLSNNGKFGIGVNPGYKLHISGATNDNDLVIQNSTHGGSLRLQANTNFMGMFSTSSKPLYFGTNNDADQMVLDTDGQLGIGTTSPNEILHIQDASTSAGTSLTIQNGYGESPKNIKFRNTDTVETARIEAFGRNFTSNLPYLAFHVNQTTSSTASNDVAERMRITSTGSVLIGNATNFAASGANDLQVGNTTGAHGISIMSNRSHNGNLFFGDNDNNDAGRIAYNHTNNRMEFYTNRSQRMVITSAGNVGIGTNAAAQKLDVRDGDITTRDSTNTNYAQLSRYVGLTLRGNGTGSRGVQTPNTDALTLGTNNTERVRITSSGYVGIGTSSPAEELEISADAPSIQLESTNASGRSYGFQSMNTGKLGIYDANAGLNRIVLDSNGNVGIGDTNPSFPLDVNNTSTRVRFKATTGHSNLELSSLAGRDYLLQSLSNGEFTIHDEDSSANRLNISTTGAITFNNAFTFPTSIGNSGQILKVPSSGTTLVWADDAGGGSATVVTDTDGDTKIQVEESADEDIIRFDTAGTQRMVITDAGRVGINTQSPAAMLHVNGGIVAVGDGTNTTYYEEDKIHSYATSGFTIDGREGITLETTSDDKDINFKIYDTTNGLETYMSVDGGEGRVVFNKWTRHVDGARILVGTGGDLAIYHDGSNSYIAEQGTGVLNISGSTQVNINAANGENGVQVIENAGVRLRHNNNVKLDTTSTGVDITGELQSDSLDVDGNADISGNLVLGGNLTVNGTTTTINAATLDVEDKNITLNYGSGDTSASANGAGITIQDAVNSSTDATILWDATNDEFDFSHPIKIAGSLGVTNIVTNKVVKFNGSILDDSNITDDGSTITLGSNTIINGTSNLNGGVSVNVDSSSTSFGNHQAALRIDNTNTTTNNWAALVFDSNNGSSAEVSARFTDHANNYADLYFANRGSGGYTTKMFISQDGNVGIGTTSPKNQLHVSGGGYFTGFTNPNGSGVAGLEIGYDGSKSVLQSYDRANGAYKPININASSASFTQGSVGIGLGTTAPSFKLHVKETGVNAGAIYVEDGTSWLRVVPNLGTSGFNPMSTAGDIGLIFSNDNDNTTNSSTNGLLIAPHSSNTSGIKILEDGRVGIGVSAPGGHLDVNGTYGDLKVGDPSVGTRLTYYNTTRMLLNSNDIMFYTNSLTERMRIKNDGKVGIGTSSPAGNLHIKSIGDVGDALLIVEADADNNVESDNPRIELRQDNNLVSGALYLEGNAATTATNSLQNGLLLDAKGASNDGGTIQFATGGLAANQSGGPTNSAVRMTILKDGNVGIGVTSPGRKLSVGGAIELTTADTTVHSAHAAIRRGSAGEMFLDAPGDIHVNLDTNNNNTDRAFRIRTNANTTDLFTVNESGNATLSGNFEATSYLSSSAGAYFNTNTGSNPVYITRSGNTDQALKIYTDDANVIFESIQDESLDNYGGYVFAMDAGTTEPFFDIRKGTSSGGTKFRVDGSGDIGIGTTTLNSYSNQRVVTINGTTHSRIDFETGGTLRGSVYGDSGGLNLDAGANYIRFYTGNTEKMRLKSNGFLGIGTDTPLDLLHLKSTSTDARAVIDGHTAFDAELKFAENGTVAYTIGHNAADDTFRVGTTNVDTDPRLIITSTGKVGIGEVNPDNSFEVLAADASIIAHWSGNSRGGIVALSSQRVGFISTSVNDDLVFGRTSNPATSSSFVERMRIDNGTGNVGIGVTNPKSKLQVEEYGIDTSSTTTTATTQVAIHTFPIADFRTARFTIQITNTTDSTYHSTEIIAVHDGTTANITEFGEVHTGSSVEATFDADISSSNFRLLATPASTDSMTFKVVCHSITV